MSWARSLNPREWAFLFVGVVIAVILTHADPEDVARERQANHKEAKNVLRATCGFHARGGTEIEAIVDLEDWGPGSSPIEFQWDFGDGSTQVTRTTRVEYREGARPMGFRQSEAVAHAYAHPGSYTLKVSVIEGARTSSCRYPVTIK